MDCPLSGIYNANSHGQRYCTSCLTWFHFGCIKQWRGIPNTSQIVGVELPIDLPDLLRDLLRVPIERGGLFGVVGNGQVQIALRQMSTQPLRLEWESNIDNQYVANVLGADHAYYACPTCTCVV